jgi:hypothetical protein
MEELMHQKLRFSLIVAIAAVALVAAGTAQAADKTDVELTLTVDDAGNAAISVDPESAQIWRNKPDKPKKVYWYTANESSYDELYWELRYDPGKGGGTANYFGDVDIECGKDSIKVQPDKKPDAPYAEWPYSVSVYSCVDGAKGDMLAEVDPRIVWKD